MYKMQIQFPRKKQKQKKRKMNKTKKKKSEKKVTQIKEENESANWKSKLKNRQNKEACMRLYIPQTAIYTPQKLYFLLKLSASDPPNEKKKKTQKTL